MQTIAEVNSLQKQILQWRQDGQSIAFVPTMGRIHQGHLALVKEAAKQADLVVVSIFANLLQLDKIIDVENQTRILENDIAQLNEAGVSLVFTPSEEEILPTNVEKHCFVEVPNFQTMLLGAENSHLKYIQLFSTTLCKFFNLIQPDVACFGEKDYQKLLIVHKIVKELCYPIKIVTVPTARELDGLVIARRNTKLTVDERQRAPVLAKTLRWASGQIRAGRRDYNELILDCKDQLRAAGLEPDEILFRDAYTLQNNIEESEQLVMLASVKLSSVNLVDNLVIDISPSNNKAPDGEEE